MVAQLPLTTKNWAGPIKFDLGQVKIVNDYIRREIFLIWGTKRKFLFETLYSTLPSLYEVERGGILVSPCPSVRLWTESTHFHEQLIDHKSLAESEPYYLHHLHCSPAAEVHHSMNRESNSVINSLPWAINRSQKFGRVRALLLTPSSLFTSCRSTSQLRNYSLSV